jgi:hypothetical protein
MDDFITFGCWNKGDPNNDTLPLHYLYPALRRSIAEKKPKFIMVTGDNYYPFDVEGEDSSYDRIEYEKQINDMDIFGGGKLARTDHLIKSFNYLTGIGDDFKIPILMCTGNHENHEEKPHEFIPESKPSTPPSSPERRDDNIDLEYLSMLKSLEEKERYLLEVNNPNNKYFVMGVGDVNYQVDESLKIKIIDTEAGVISEDPILDDDINFIFGHKPLFSLHYKLPKQKGGKMKAGKNWAINDNVNSYFKLLASKYPRKHCVYICADTHNYQDIVITYSNDFTLRQIVVGSGGTFKMDLLPPDDIDFITDPKLVKMIGENDIKKVHMVKSQCGNHGFCRCSISKPGENIFIPYFNAVEGVGYLSEGLTAQAKKKQKKKHNTKKRNTKKRNTKKKINKSKKHKRKSQKHKSRKRK